LGTGQKEQIERIRNMQEEMSSSIYDYWLSYSNMSTWQFWVSAGMLVLPIIALYFLLDRKKALLIGFYGFNVHVWFHYMDAFSVTHGYVEYPFKAVPILPTSLALDVSFIPVTFMLLYQWILKHNKSYYLYTIGYSFILSFLFKPAMISFGLFQLYKGMNYGILFLNYIGIVVLSKLITDLFRHFEREHLKPTEHRAFRKLQLKRFFEPRIKAK
jgi:hypothetical protein